MAQRWLGSDERILRLTAAGALGSSPRGREHLSTLVRMLDEPVAYDRLRYLYAVEEIIGRPLTEDEFDLTALPRRRREQVARLSSDPAALLVHGAAQP
jgi:hypothetical protein